MGSFDRAVKALRWNCFPALRKKCCFFSMANSKTQKRLLELYTASYIVGNLRLNLCYALSIECMDYLRF